MSKIIFLDIDGVLNNHALRLRDGMDAIGEEFLDLLKLIVDATGAEIVLSSTWRKTERDRALVREALKTRGMKFIATTLWADEGFRYIPRRDEIREWLSRHPEVEKFAILDDDVDAGIVGSFFCTENEFDDQTGLSMRIVNEVIEHLGRSDG